MHEILTDKQKVVFVSGDSLVYDKLLIATGGNPKSLSVPGADLKGVFLFRSLQDSNDIIDALKNTESVAVIGAGFIGMEAASSLIKRGLKVHVIAPEKYPMTKIFGDAPGKRLKELHEKKGVKFHLGKTPKKILGEVKAEAIELSDNSVIKVQCVIVGLGIDPAVDFIRNTALVQNNEVPVNEKLETKVNNIYAAGDIALLNHPILHENQRVEHWAVAERQGKFAAKSMLGQDIIYDEIPFFWTMQHGKPLSYTGFAPDYDKMALRGNFGKRQLSDRLL